MIETLFDRLAVVIHIDTNGEDDFGNPVIEITGTDEWPCRLWQMSSQETLGAQDRVDTDWGLELPATAELAATDRVSVDGMMFEVVGTPDRVHRPIGGPTHIEARVRLVTGG